MRLVTFQTKEALKDLINNGYLECNDELVDVVKAGPTYDWVIKKMNEKVKNNSNSKYPLWCWVKCYNGICPPKHKGESVDTFQVKITFNKKEKDVFIMDFRRYSFLLSNTYIPKNMKEKKDFDEMLKEKNITAEELKAYVRKDKYKTHRTDKEFLDVCKKINESFDRCITKDSDVLQGCIWKISLDEVEKIEILNDKNYRFGSLNYIRSNGKRKDWKEEFYKILEYKNEKE